MHVEWKKIIIYPNRGRLGEYVRHTVYVFECFCLKQVMVGYVEVG